MRSFSLEASGRTTLVYHIMAEAQRRGGICAFIDAEHAMDPQYARRIGVDIDQLLVSQPDTGEQALVLVVVELLVGNVPPGMILRFAVRTEDDRDRPLVFLFPSEGLSS